MERLTCIDAMTRYYIGSDQLGCAACPNFGGRLDPIVLRSVPPGSNGFPPDAIVARSVYRGRSSVRQAERPPGRGLSTAAEKTNARENVELEYNGYRFNARRPVNWG
jgi:hypothetical protein